MIGFQNNTFHGSSFQARARIVRTMATKKIIEVVNKVVAQKKNHVVKLTGNNNNKSAANNKQEVIKAKTGKAKI